MFYALNVGKGWIEIRECSKPPKLSIVGCRVGPTTLKFKRFVGGEARAVVTSSIYRKLSGKRLPPARARVAGELAEKLIQINRRSVSPETSAD